MSKKEAYSVYQSETQGFAVWEEGAFYGGWDAATKELQQDNERLKKDKEAYKECFEEFVPIDKQDQANLFLSTYGSGLAKELAKKEK